MFRDKILPAFAGLFLGLIAAILALWLFPKHWMDLLGFSDLMKGLVKIGVVMGSWMWVSSIVERRLKRKA